MTGRSWRNGVLAGAAVLLVLGTAGCARDRAARAANAPGVGALGAADAAAALPPEAAQKLAGEWSVKDAAEGTSGALSLGRDGKLAIKQTYKDSTPGASGTLSNDRSGTWSSPPDGNEVTFRYDGGGEVKYKAVLVDAKTLVLTSSLDSTRKTTYTRK